MGLFDFGNTLSSSNQDSPVGLLGGRLQKWTDPLTWIPGGIGDKWGDLTSHDIPKWTNQVLAPVARFNGKIDKAVNPLRKIPAVNNVMDTVEAKPADAIGTAVGAYFAAPALAGAMGGGSAGGAAGGSVGGTGTITAAPGVGVGGDALGSTAGMSGSWGQVAGGTSPWMSAAQQMLKQQASGGGLFGNQNQQQPQQVQLGAASAQPVQAGISSGPVVPSIRNQMMAQALMRGY